MYIVFFHDLLYKYLVAANCRVISKYIFQRVYQILLFSLDVVVSVELSV